MLERETPQKDLVTPIPALTATKSETPRRHRSVPPQVRLNQNVLIQEAPVPPKPPPNPNPKTFASILSPSLTAISHPSFPSSLPLLQPRPRQIFLKMA